MGLLILSTNGLATGADFHPASKIYLAASSDDDDDDDEEEEAVDYRDRVREVQSWMHRRNAQRRQGSDLPSPDNDSPQTYGSYSPSYRVVRIRRHGIHHYHHHAYRHTSRHSLRHKEAHRHSRSHRVRQAYPHQHTYHHGHAARHAQRQVHALRRGSSRRHGHAVSHAHTVRHGHGRSHVHATRHVHAVRRGHPGNRTKLQRRRFRQVRNVPHSVHTKASHPALKKPSHAAVKAHGPKQLGHAKVHSKKPAAKAKPVKKGKSKR